MPANVKSAYVSIAGGGAGGVSGFDGNPAAIMISGASGGFLSSYPINLTPGEVVPITVGNGGAAGIFPNGGPGGDTSFGSYLICTGALKNIPTCEAEACPGSCGAQGGNGTLGQYIVTNGGYINGGQTPLGYGSGGPVTRCYGCLNPNPTVGSNGSQGVVIVDVLY